MMMRRGDHLGHAKPVEKKCSLQEDLENCSPSIVASAVGTIVKRGTVELWPSVYMSKTKYFIFI